MGKSRNVFTSAKAVAVTHTPPPVLVFKIGSKWLAQCRVPHCCLGQSVPRPPSVFPSRFLCLSNYFFLPFHSPHQEEEKNEHDRLLAVQETWPWIGLDQGLPNQELKWRLQIASRSLCAVESRGGLLVLENVGNAKNATMVGNDIWFVSWVELKWLNLQTFRWRHDSHRCHDPSLGSEKVARTCDWGWVHFDLQ